MSAKSSRPELGWYTTSNGVVRYVVVFAPTKEYWLVTSNTYPNVYEYEWENSPLHRDNWHLEKLNG